ncbi:glycine cleavage system protein GcvH [Peterkaempfera bronchialis]|uniref:glycine cleavage system protein GcvH n=1 Tax=Peterkaempfera bronchialis TaxID=2126346 RepID=UPI003C2B44E1
MTDIPSDLRYSKDHEWVRSTESGRLRIGITDHAQRQLGDIVFVELPKVGDRLEAEEPFGSLESVKAVSEVYMPVAGKVVAVNDSLGDAAEQINEEPYGDGWLIEVEASDPATVDGLLTAAQYQDFLTAEE